MPGVLVKRHLHPVRVALYVRGVGLLRREVEAAGVRSYRRGEGARASETRDPERMAVEVNRHASWDCDDALRAPVGVGGKLDALCDRCVSKRRYNTECCRDKRDIPHEGVLLCGLTHSRTPGCE